MGVNVNLWQVFTGFYKIKFYKNYRLGGKNLFFGEKSLLFFSHCPNRAFEPNLRRLLLLSNEEAAQH